MKKTLIAAAVLAAAGVGSVYYVGSYTQQQVATLIEQTNQQNNGVTAKLVSYDKGFFSAQSQVELTIEHPEFPDQQWQLLSVANIEHWPYKAVVNSTVSVVDDATKVIVEELFGTAAPLTARDEVNVFGKLQGQAQLAPIDLADTGNSVKMTPVTMNYTMDLNKMSGHSLIKLASLDIQGDESFTLTGIEIDGEFAQLADTALMTYDYRFKLDEAKVLSDDGSVDLNQLSLQTAFKKGVQSDTLDTNMALNVGKYVLMGDENLAFSNTALELNVTGLDQAALVGISNLQTDPSQLDEALVQQLFLDLAGKGAQVSISKLASQTPWGDVNADVSINLPAGVINETIFSTGPQAALAQITGSANASLPEKLLTAPGVGDQLNFAMMMGILAKEGEALVLKGTLKDGQLVVNDNTFPIM